MATGTTCYTLDEHRLAITVGDIVGRGVQAAAAMGQLRSAARAMARLVEDPGALLGALDEFTATTGQGRYSSMAYLVVDTLHGELQYSIAGHPPPVLRTPDGAVELLQTEGAPLLGITCNRATVRRPLAPGSWLVVYTDGLIERRAEGLDVRTRPDRDGRPELGRTGRPGHLLCLARLPTPATGRGGGRRGDRDRVPLDMRRDMGLT